MLNKYLCYEVIIFRVTGQNKREREKVFPFVITWFGNSNSDILKLLLSNSKSNRKIFSNCLKLVSFTADKFIGYYRLK